MKTATKIIVFFGPPGSGKGTQADMLGQDLAIPVISPGELLRHERDTGTAIGQAAAAVMAQGRLVDDKIVETVLDKRFENPDLRSGFILDGFPRRAEQLDYFKSKLNGLAGFTGKVLAIYIDVSDQEIEQRISGRRVCDCGTSYHVTNNPPQQAGVCDLCGKDLYQRQDDRPEILAERLRGFHVRIKPLLKFFDQEHVLVRVDGAKNIEELREDIKVLANKIL